MKRSRVPGTTVVQDHRFGGRVIYNPNWSEEELAKLAAGQIVAACHDGTPCMDFMCVRCGGANHLHLSQIDGASDETEVAFRCAYCRGENIPGLSIRALRRALAPDA